MKTRANFPNLFMLAIAFWCAPYISRTEAVFAGEKKPLDHQVTLRQDETQNLEVTLNRIASDSPFIVNVEVVKQEEKSILDISALNLKPGIYKLRDILQLFQQKLQGFRFEVSDESLYIAVGDVRGKSPLEQSIAGNHEFKLTVAELFAEFASWNPQFRVGWRTFDTDLAAKKFNFALKDKSTVRDVLKNFALQENVEWFAVLYEKPTQIEIRLKGEDGIRDIIPGPSGSIHFKKKK